MDTNAISSKSKCEGKVSYWTPSLRLSLPRREWSYHDRGQAGGRWSRRLSRCSSKLSPLTRPLPVRALRGEEMELRCGSGFRGSFGRLGCGAVFGLNLNRTYRTHGTYMTEDLRWTGLH